MTFRILGAVAGITAATTLMVALATPGHHTDSPLNPVAQAATTTAAAGSADFDISGTVTTHGQRVALNGNGAVDLRTQRARVSLGVPLPVIGTQHTDAILDGSSVYVHLPAFLTGGKPWVKADLGEIGKHFGIDPKELQQSTGASPAALLKTLESVGGAKRIGPDRIAGVSTTHYRATIDPKKALEELPSGANASALQQMLAKSGLSSIPMDVWIDGSGRVKRESIRFSATGTAADLTLTFNHFGVSVDTTPPAADQVMDAAALLGS
jgi:hypothetical protein